MLRQQIYNGQQTKSCLGQADFLKQNIFPGSSYQSRLIPLSRPNPPTLIYKSISLCFCLSRSYVLFSVLLSYYYYFFNVYVYYFFMALCSIPPTSLSVYMYKLINMLFFCTLTWAPDAGATFVP